MNLEQALSYVTHRSESIIQWLFFTILLLAGYLIARGLFGKSASASAEAPAEFQAALQKILDQTAKLESVSLDKLGSADLAGVDAQVQALKTELQTREAELAQYKSGGGGSGGSGGEMTADVSSRIKELEAKLAEYEILEDDIADLSLYKEENTRLRAEVEKIKTGGGAAAADTGGAAPRTAEGQGDDIVAEFAEAVKDEPAASEPSAPLDMPESDDPMKDFEAAMSVAEDPAAAAEAAPEPASPEPEPEPAPEPAPAPAPEPIPEPTPEPSPAPEPVATAPAPAPAATPVPAPAAAAPASPPADAGPPGEADDLFAEFAFEKADPADEAGSLDTDKMMEEMAALVTGETASADDALKESIDTDKMASEASTFEKS